MSMLKARPRSSSATAIIDEFSGLSRTPLATASTSRFGNAACWLAAACARADSLSVRMRVQVWRRLVRSVQFLRNREYLACRRVVVGVPADNHQAGQGSGRDV